MKTEDKFTIICAYCGKTTQKGTGSNPQISHGVCRWCCRKELAKESMRVFFEKIKNYFRK